MKVYISGQITGLDNFAELFEQAQIELELQGHEVINPVKIEHNHDKTWRSYMKNDIKALCDCDAIYMLPNWCKSSGARLENHIALRLGLQVIV